MFRLFTSVAALLFDTKEPKISWYLHQYFPKLAVFLNPSYPHSVSICSTIAAQFMILFLLKNLAGRNLDHCSLDSMWKKKKRFCGDPPPLNYTEHIKVFCCAIISEQILTRSFILSYYNIMLPWNYTSCTKWREIIQFLLLVVILKLPHIHQLLEYCLILAKVESFFFELAKVYASDSPFWRETSVQAQ